MAASNFVLVVAVFAAACCIASTVVVAQYDDETYGSYDDDGQYAIDDDYIGKWEDEEAPPCTYEGQELQTLLPAMMKVCGNLLGNANMECSAQCYNAFQGVARLWFCFEDLEWDDATEVASSYPALAKSDMKPAVAVAMVFTEAFSRCHTTTVLPTGPSSSKRGDCPSVAMAQFVTDVVKPFTTICAGVDGKKDCSNLCSHQFSLVRRHPCFAKRFSADVHGGALGKREQALYAAASDKCTMKLDNAKLLSQMCQQEQLMYFTSITWPSFVDACRSSKGLHLTPGDLAAAKAKAKGKTPAEIAKAKAAARAKNRQRNRQNNPNAGTRGGGSGAAATRTPAAAGAGQKRAGAGSGSAGAAAAAAGAGGAGKKNARLLAGSGSAAGSAAAGAGAGQNRNRNGNRNWKARVHAATCSNSCKRALEQVIADPYCLEEFEASVATRADHPNVGATSMLTDALTTCNLEHPPPPPSYSVVEEGVDDDDDVSAATRTTAAAVIAAATVVAAAVATMLL